MTAATRPSSGIMEAADQLTRFAIPKRSLDRMTLSTKPILYVDWKIYYVLQEIRHLSWLLYV